MKGSEKRLDRAQAALGTQTHESATVVQKAAREWLEFGVPNAMLAGNVKEKSAMNWVDCGWRENSVLIVVDEGLAPFEGLK